MISLNILSQLFELSNILASVVAGGKKRGIFSALGPKLLPYFDK